DLLARAAGAGVDAADAKAAIELAQQAYDARRDLGNPVEIIDAGILLMRVMSWQVGDPAAAAVLGQSLADEFPETLDAAIGAQLMISIAASLRASGAEGRGLPWIERALPIAEELEDTDSIVGGIGFRGVELIEHGRPAEGMVLLRGAHQ